MESCGATRPHECMRITLSKEYNFFTHLIASDSIKQSNLHMLPAIVQCKAMIDI